MHEEYWVPAEDLPAFNDNIVGAIEVIARFTEADQLAAEAKAGAARQVTVLGNVHDSKA
jgi:hypothetical protein